MKFGRQLREEQVTSPPQFDSFIQYKHLKKFLKYRSLNNATTATQEEAFEAEKAFLKMLHTQLKDVDRRFQKEARKVISAYEVQSANNRCTGYILAVVTCRRGAMSSQDAKDLAKRARWCRRYAEVNYLAVRKIAKKRDRLLGGRVGEEFVQACLRGEVKARTFMSASLLAELAAIERMMLDKAGEGDLSHGSQYDAEPGRIVGALWDAAGNASRADQTATCDPSDDGSEFDREYTCAVCMDLLYQPVSLSCGHVFCARCALAVAVGHTSLIGNAESLLLRIADTDRPCPSCRTAAFGRRREKESVFADTTRLSRLERLIQQKYPQEWQRRKEEDAGSQAALKASRPTAWDSFRHSLARFSTATVTYNNQQHLP